MSIGLPGSKCDTELEIIKETVKAYQLKNQENMEFWLPKSAFDFRRELSHWGYGLYHDKVKEYEEKQKLLVDRENCFNYELSLIKDDNIRNWTIKALNSLPEYIFTIPASSTGKHHPQFSLGNGGLVRHIKVAVGFANRLFTILDFTDEEKDIIVASLLLHDGLKCGIPQRPFTAHEHSLLICEHLRNQEFFNEIPQAEEICEAIKSHMGKWQKSEKSSIILPLPETKVQKFVHQCDFLSAWKELDFKFDENKKGD